MSYARFGGDSDVYVVRTGTGTRVCYGCDFTVLTAREMLEHLEHGHQDDQVPEDCLERLRREAAEEEIPA